MINTLRPEFTSAASKRANRRWFSGCRFISGSSMISKSPIFAILFKYTASSNNARTELEDSESFNFTLSFFPVRGMNRIPSSEATYSPPIISENSLINQSLDLAQSLLRLKIWGQAPRKAYFTRVCDSRRRQHSWHHCQQLGDLLRVAGGVGSDAAAEAVDGRAKAMQLDVVGFGESRMEDGCVEIVLGFDTKDGCVVVGAWLLAGWGNGCNCTHFGR